jgi:hypothetical protein
MTFATPGGFVQTRCTGLHQVGSRSPAGELYACWILIISRPTG